LQGAKARNPADSIALDQLARAVVATMTRDTLYIVGPGTTTRGIMTLLGLESTLLGVDVIRSGDLVSLDVGDRELLRLVRDHPRAKIIVTPIGGQGHLFGRGNQQISARVLRAVGIENVIVVATPGKLASLAGRPFLVDTDDEGLNRAFPGHIPVTTGDRQEAIYPIGYRPTDRPSAGAQLDRTAERG
jgi:predicted polyphosphate/ATP-dependent NAD kinase